MISMAERNSIQERMRTDWCMDRPTVVLVRVIRYTASFIMAVSCGVFCCLGVDTYFHVLEGFHLLCHWLTADRRLM